MVLYNHRREHTNTDRKDNTMKNEIIDTHTDRNGNKWERKNQPKLCRRKNTQCFTRTERKSKFLEEFLKADTPR